MMSDDKTSFQMYSQQQRKAREDNKSKKKNEIGKQEHRSHIAYRVKP